MKANIVYVKISDGVRTEIKYEDMTEEERKGQAVRSKICLFRAMGYEPIDVAYKNHRTGDKVLCALGEEKTPKTLKNQRFQTSDKNAEDGT